MESQKQNNSNSNGFKTPLYLSSNLLYPQNTPLSFNSLVEIVPAIAKKSSDRLMKGQQMGPQIQNKRAVSQNPEKTESCKKMRKDVDKSSNSFVAWSPDPQEWKNATKAYLTRGKKSSTINDKAPTTPNFNSSSRQNDSVVDKSPVETNFERSSQIIDLVVDKTPGPSFERSSQIIEPGRANDMNVVDQSLAGQNIDSSLQIVEFDMETTFGQPKRQIKLVPVSTPGEEVVMNNLDSSTSRMELEPIKSSEVVEKKIPRSEFTSNFQTFRVVVNGFNIDSDLGDDIRAKYFDLCSSQGLHLHAQLLKIIDAKLAVEIISTVTEISEWIRNCNLISNLADFEERRTILQGFEMFGMNLGFLIKRLNTIYGILFESTMEVDLEKCKNAKIERVRVEEEKKDLELKLLELEKETMRLDSEIDAIEENAEKYEGRIREEACAPW